MKNQQSTQPEIPPEIAAFGAKAIDALCSETKQQYASIAQQLDALTSLLQHSDCASPSADSSAPCFEFAIGTQTWVFPATAFSHAVFVEVGIRVYFHAASGPWAVDLRFHQPGKPSPNARSFWAELLRTMIRGDGPRQFPVTVGGTEIRSYSPASP